MKTCFKIVSLLLAVLLLPWALIGCSGAGDPLGYLKDSAERTVKEALLGEVLSVLFTAMDGGSLSFDFGGTDLVEGVPEAMNLKLWLNAEDEELAANASMVIGGERFSGEFYLTESDFVTLSPAFLGSNTLGLKFDTLAQDLRVSVFNANSGTEFSDHSVTEETATRVDQLKNAIFQVLSSTEDTLEFVDVVLDVFLDQLTQYATNTRYTENGCTYVSLSVDNDALSRTLRAARAELVDDGFFCDYLTDLAAVLDTMDFTKDGVVTNTYSQRVRYFLTSEADMDELCLKIDTAAHFTFTLDAVVRSFGMSLEQLNVTFTQDGVKRLDAALVLASDVGAESSLSVTFDGVQRRFTYQVNEDGYSAYRAVLSYRMTDGAGTDVTVSGALDANKSSKSYTLTLNKGAQTRAFSGSYLFDSDEVMLAVNSVSVDGVQKRLSLKLHVLASDSVPDAPAYVNMITMDATKLRPIKERDVAAKDRLKGNIEAKGVSLYSAWSGVLEAIGLPEEIPAPPENE